MNHTKPAKTKCGHRIYQLDCEEYDRLVDHAGNRCQICGISPEQTKHGFLVVDHDALVGQWAVRGLLCSTCNTNLPAGTAPSWAADYLRAPWWRREVERLGLSTERLPEPALGSVVLTPNRDKWRRGPEGWQQTANWRHKPTLSWDRLNSRFGPHRIRVLSGRPEGRKDTTPAIPASGTTRYLCPLECGWHHDVPPPGVDRIAELGAAADPYVLDPYEAVNSIARDAYSREAAQTETALREHLTTHTPEQFVRVIHDLRVEVAALRERPVSGEEASG